MEKSCYYCLVTNRKAITLNCDHILCKLCIVFLSKNNSFECPFCYANFQVTDEIRSSSVPINTQEIQSKTEPNKQKILESNFKHLKNESSPNIHSETSLKLNLLHSSLSQRKKELKNLLNICKFLTQILKIPELYSQIEKIVSSSLEEVLNLVKKFGIFRISDQNINLNLDPNTIIITVIQQLSDVALKREMKQVGGPNQLAWLGNKVSVFKDTSQFLNDHITVTSQFPIIVMALGVGLSPCSRSGIKYLSLKVSDDKGNLVNSFALRENRNENSRLTFQYNLNPELLLESGVRYQFTYEVQASYVYIITDKQIAKYKNYLINNEGASMTFYLKLYDIS